MCVCVLVCVCVEYAIQPTATASSPIPMLLQPPPSSSSLQHKRGGNCVACSRQILRRPARDCPRFLPVCVCMSVCLCAFVCPGLVWLFVLLCLLRTDIFCPCLALSKPPPRMKSVTANGCRECRALQQPRPLLFPGTAGVCVCLCVSVCVSVCLCVFVCMCLCVKEPSWLAVAIQRSSLPRTHTHALVPALVLWCSMTWRWAVLSVR